MSTADNGVPAFLSPIVPDAVCRKAIELRRLLSGVVERLERAGDDFSQTMSRLNDQPKPQGVPNERRTGSP